MVRFRFLPALLCLLGTLALAQTDKPGPMQSGTHTQSDTTKPADAPAASNAGGGQYDVPKLFATTCGWCHLDGGRVAGKGPQLMGTTKTDEEIKSRVRNGKPGQMPAFGPMFNDDQLNAIVAYIRGLK